MEFNATFIVAFISFITFVFIMNQILYKPISDIVEKRKKLIDDNYNEASLNNAKKEELLSEKQEKIRNAHLEAREKTTQFIENAKKEQSNLILNAKNEAKIKVEKSTEEVNLQSENAKQALKSEIIDLAQIISNKFIETPDKIEADYEIIENIMQR